jgi:adenine specific DNA methylase Mod
MSSSVNRTRPINIQRIGPTKVKKDRAPIRSKNIRPNIYSTNDRFLLLEFSFNFIKNDGIIFTRCDKV